MQRDPEIDRQIDEIEQMAARIGPQFAGVDRMVQGGVLAELLATWIAGHRVRGDAGALDALHEQLLAQQVEVVRRLVRLRVEALDDAR